ncbi:MAG: toprim domain-containing protein, partial [Solirubrobacteraceae bacterium]
MSPSDDQKGRKVAAAKAKAKPAKAAVKEAAGDKGDKHKGARAAKPTGGHKPAAPSKAKPDARTKTKADAKPAPAKGKPAGKTAKAPKGKAAEPEHDHDEHDEHDEPARKPKKVKPGSALVVVESPAKARTIGKYLGSGFVVKASVGHVRDLPKSKIGVDLENNFEPVYEVIEGKKKVVAEIRKAARENETVYLASDPDREGEAIAWHISEEIKDVNSNLKRVLINEITKKGVAAAIAAPQEIDMHKTDAQQARRILDRIVGYEISPILWNKVQR